jgi:mono/diheme cytochrome c family protein
VPRPSDEGHEEATVGGRHRVAAVLGALVVLAACGGESDGDGAPTAAAEPDPQRGEQLFDANCAACHGPAGQGTVSGPPLVHVIYEPGHHSDESFHLAVQRGVQQHHWDFGPMPAVPGLSREEVADIIAYVRDLQREAGIIE